MMASDETNEPQDLNSFIGVVSFSITPAYLTYQACMTDLVYIVVYYLISYFVLGDILLYKMAEMFYKLLVMENSMKILW